MFELIAANPLIVYCDVRQLQAAFAAGAVFLPPPGAADNADHTAVTGAADSGNSSGDSGVILAIIVIPHAAVTVP